MAIKVTKPEINLREKLAELDFDQVPYHKIPKGSSIQTNYTLLPGSGTSNESETNSSTFQQTNFTVTINPRFKNSLFKVEAAPNAKMNNNNAYQTVGVFRKIGDGGFVQIPNDSTLAPHGLMTLRWLGSTTWWGIVPILVFDKPNTLEPVEYRIFQRNSSNGSFLVRIGENGADEHMSVTEIKQ